MRTESKSYRLPTDTVLGDAAHSVPDTDQQIAAVRNK